MTAINAEKPAQAAKSLRSEVDRKSTSNTANAMIAVTLAAETSVQTLERSSTQDICAGGIVDRYERIVANFDRGCLFLIATRPCITNLSAFWPINV